MKDAKKKPHESSRNGSVHLTRRERQVLRLVSQGYARKEIASALSISRSTVGFHLDHIYRKLEAHGRMPAIRAAIRLGLLH